MTPPIDPIAQRADLERQLALLEPVLQHLRHEVAPRALVPEEWRGPAAQAGEGFLDELRQRLDLAADGVDDVLRIVRLQLGVLP